MSAHRCLLVLSAGALLTCLPGLAQQPPAPAVKPPAAPGQQDNLPRFVGSVTEVNVPVTVTDDRGKYVSNLEARDFRILDEGKPQRLQFFSHNQKQPIVVGFLVDMSNNTKIHWKTFQDALEELVFTLLPGDARYSGYLISYSNDAELLVNTTTDYNKLADKIRKMKPGGGSALYDAIYMSCVRRELVKGEPYEPRRIIIVIGDGHDNASKHSRHEVLELAQRNLVTIFAVSTQAFGFANEDRDVLEQLTTKTGGHVEYPMLNPYKDISGYLSQPSDAGNYAITVGTGGYAAQIAKGITEATASLSGEISTQYVLRYIPEIDPESKPKVYRKIEVSIPGLPNVKIRAREGYYPQGIPPGPEGGQ
jgi:VWFA-related protein